MGRRPFDTLKLERNVARLPAFWPRTGVPLERALSARVVPFHVEAFQVRALVGALGPLDLVALTHLCTLYLARRPMDRRIDIDLGEVASWLGRLRIGGEQRRVARATIDRLVGATFTSIVRADGRASKRFVEGWHLLDRSLIPERARGGGSVWLSATVAELLDAGSVVYLDPSLQLELLRCSPIAHRLWVYLEAETLHARSPQRYALFDAPPGLPARPRTMAAITDMLRLTDQQRRQVVFAVNQARKVINELDPRYQLSVERAAEPGMWNLVALRHRTPAWASQATLAGEPGNAIGAPWATADGDPGNARVDGHGH